MEIIYFLLPASLLIALIGFFAYLWSVRSGQYEDLDTPALRMLSDDDEVEPQTQVSKKDPQK